MFISMVAEQMVLVPRKGPRTRVCVRSHVPAHGQSTVCVCQWVHRWELDLSPDRGSVHMDEASSQVCPCLSGIYKESPPSSNHPCPPVYTDMHSSPHTHIQGYTYVCAPQSHIQPWQCPQSGEDGLVTLATGQEQVSLGQPYFKRKQKSQPLNTKRPDEKREVGGATLNPHLCTPLLTPPVRLFLPQLRAASQSTGLRSV